MATVKRHKKALLITALVLSGVAVTAGAAARRLARETEDA